MALTDPLRSEIVTRLARYESKAAIQAWLQQEHGIAVGLNDLCHYDPDLPSGSRLAQKWKALHAAQRQAYNEGMAAVGLAQEVHRLHLANRVTDRLLRIADRMEANDNLRGAAEMLEKVRPYLEHAARERGGSFTNRHQVTGLQGFVNGLTPAEAEALAALPPDQLRELLPAGLLTPGK